MSGFERLLSGLSGPQRLLAFLAVVLAASLLLAFGMGGPTATLPVLVGINLLLWITRPIWLPADQGPARWRLASLSAVLAVATLVAAGPPIEVLLAALTTWGLLGTVPDWLNGLLQIDRFTAVMLMAFTLVAVFIVNWLGRDTSTMKQHPTPLEEEFPERRYREKRQQFCEVLRSHLRDLNRKTRWSEAHFTPLDAEVEVLSQGRSKRRLTDLMSALRGDRQSRVFLVLGDPGSGKSVALRTLAMQLLGVPESSWLIERLSQVISTFLAGATETRGVLASRLFRRPTLTLDDGATLEIRPFDEARIARTLKNSLLGGDTRAGRWRHRSDRSGFSPKGA